MNSDEPAIRVAAAIRDFSELVNTLAIGVSGPLPWQRQLVAHLDGLAGVVQILRMSVVLERSDAEVREAAQVLVEHTRHASLAVAGSRADPMVRVALRLALSLALTIRTGLPAPVPAAGEAAPMRRRA